MADDELFDGLITIAHRQRSAEVTVSERDFTAGTAGAAHVEINRLRTVLAPLVALAANSAWDKLGDHLTHQGFGYSWAVEGLQSEPGS